MYIMLNKQVDFGSIVRDPAIRVPTASILGASVIGIQ